MSLQRIILSMVVIWLGIMGIACGILCLVCLMLYVLWHGLAISSVALAFICLLCLSVAVMLSSRAANRHEPNGVRGGVQFLRTYWRSVFRGNDMPIDRSAATLSTRATTAKSLEKLEGFNAGNCHVTK